MAESIGALCLAEDRGVMDSDIRSGVTVQGKTEQLSQYGVGTVLKSGGGKAKVEFRPS